MRVILDTSILVSALLVPASVPGRICRAWEAGDFVLLVSKEQIRELRSTLQKPALSIRIRGHSMGDMLNQLKRLAEIVDPLPRVERSPDPEDDFLLAMAEAGNADYLVTGDKSGLLSLVRHAGTRIITAREFADRFV